MTAIRSLPVPAPAALLLAVLAACGGGSSSNPGPAPGECLRDVDCDDGIDCTEDVCGLSVNGVRRCEHVPRSERCADGSECLAESALGAGCIERVALWCAGRAEGDPCTPDDACATGDAACRGGRCTYARKACADVACLVLQGCNAATGRCDYGPEPDGTACDTDGWACSRDECRDGQCLTVVDECDCGPSRACPAPADLCLRPGRCVEGACVYDPVQCPPDEACRTYACSPDLGQCVRTAANPGGPCDDGHACTDGDACQDGECVGVPRECGADRCRTGTCVEPVGCVFGNVDDGVPCDDGDPCDGPDACADGACVAVGPAVDCDDGDPCTADSCGASDGACRHAPVPDCCGNGVLEAGEDCDPGHDPAPLCTACRFDVGELSVAGSSPAVAWSDRAGLGIAVWEASDGPDGLGLRTRTVDAQGRLGPPTDVPDAVPGPDGHFTPAVVAMPDGRFLLAFDSGTGVGLRLLGSSGAPLDDATVALALEDGDTPGVFLAAGATDGAVLLAWQVLHAVGGATYSKVRAAWVAFVADGIVTSVPFPVAGDPDAGVSAWPGAVCVGGAGGIVTLLTRGGTTTRTLGTVLVGTDPDARTPQDLDAFPGEPSVPPRCVALADGTFRVAWARPAADGGTDGVARAVTAGGVVAGEAWSVYHWPAQADAPLDVPYPGVSALAPWGDGLGYVSAFIQGPSLAAPSDVVLREVSFARQPGEAASPVPLPGAQDGFALAMDVTAGPAGAMLVVWQRLDRAAVDRPPGAIRLRFLAPP